MYKVVVGSKLHGLADADSDTDLKGVWIASLEEVLDPWRKLDKAKNPTPDETYYELSHFARLLASCNPTVLEVAYSPLVIENDPRVRNVLVFASQALDAKRIKDACIGYAESQLKKVNTLNGRRRNKAMVAAYRMYWMGLDLLDNKTFDPRLSGSRRDFARDVKEHGTGVKGFEADARYYKRKLNDHPADFKQNLNTIRYAVINAYKTPKELA